MTFHTLVKKYSISRNNALQASSEPLFYCYQAYGLTIHSQLQLPQLVKGIRNDYPDIVVRYGKVRKFLENVTDSGIDWQISSKQFLLRIDGVAEYWANGAGEVWIDRDRNASDDDVRLWLLGSTFGFLLHLRRILPLHASAISTDKGAVLFTGVSGAGKSTTLGAMVKRGYAMLADDVSGIVLDEQGCPQVLPAFPCSRMFADSAAKLKRSTEGVSQVKASLNKYLFPIDNFCSESLPIYKIYVLTNNEQPEIELQPVEKNIDKLSYFLVNTYRKRFVKAISWEKEQFKLISQVIHKTRVTKVTRPSQAFLLDQLVEYIEKDFSSRD